MKVIIVGAGDVGYVAAETIAEIHDVLIIEKDADVAESVKSHLNVSVLHEDGTNPKILSYAMESHGAQIVISTLHRDDSNLFTCMMAKRFDPTVKTIASITNPDFMIKTTAEGYPGVDVVISPEIITAQKMYHLAVLENAVDYEYLESLDMHFCIFAVESYHPIQGKVVMNLPTDEGYTIFGIYRDGNLELEVDTMEIHAGDRLCVMGTKEGLNKMNETIGVEYMAREFVILGGSIVGSNLAKMLSTDAKKRYVKIIDKDPEACMHLSKSLSGVVVINNDYTDPDVQSAENVFKTDCTISTSRQDDTNLLMCMSAQKYNARKVISRYFKKEYKDIFTFTGLESIIGYYRIVADEITKCTVSDETALMRMREPNELFFLHIVDDSSKLLNKYMGDLRIPSGLRLLAIRRNGEMIYPRMDTFLTKGDEVIVLTTMTKEADLARVFGKNVAAEL